MITCLPLHVVAIPLHRPLLRHLLVPEPLISCLLSLHLNLTTPPSLVCVSNTFSALTGVGRTPQSIALVENIAEMSVSKTY